MGSNWNGRATRRLLCLSRGGGGGGINSVEQAERLPQRRRPAVNADVSSRSVLGRGIIHEETAQPPSFTDRSIALNEHDTVQTHLRANLGGGVSAQYIC